MSDEPYTPDQKRVAEYIVDLLDGAVGAGDDPIGFLLASHEALIERCRRIKPILAAADAVVARWDTPLWKDVEPTGHVINQLRAALVDYRSR